MDQALAKNCERTLNTVDALRIQKPKHDTHIHLDMSDADNAQPKLNGHIINKAHHEKIRFIFAMTLNRGLNCRL